MQNYQDYLSRKYFRKVCHIGSNVISFVFRNFNQKGGNPLKGGKITSLYNLLVCFMCHNIIDGCKNFKYSFLQI